MNDLKYEITEILNKIGFENNESIEFASNILSFLDNAPYKEIILYLTGLEINETEAKLLWEEILSHKKLLKKKFGRDIDLKTVVTDLFTKSGKDIEIESFYKKDILTGLENKEAFYEKYIEEIKRAKRYKKIFSLAIMEISIEEDNKLLNFEILRKIAGTIKKALRTSDYIFKYDKNKFIIIFTETSKEDAALAIERLYSIIKQTDFGKKVIINTGISTFFLDSSDKDELLNFAEESLTNAKSNKYSFVCYKENKIFSPLIYWYKKHLLPIFWKKSSITFLLFTVFSLFISLLLILKILISSEIKLSQERIKSETSWKLIFEDNFNRKNLGNQWKQYSGLWEIKNNALTVEGTESFIYFNIPITGNIRMEFDAWYQKNGKSPSDLGCFILGKSKSPYETSYFFDFGAYENTRTKIERLATEIKSTWGLKIKPNKHYKIIVEHIDGILNFYINNKLVLSYTDFFPLIGEEHNTIGFYSWNGNQYYDNLKIYTQTLSEKTEILKIGDTYFNEKVYDKAIEKYMEIYNVYKEQKIGDKALYKIGMCYLYKSDFEHSILQFNKLINSKVDEEIKAYSFFQKIRVTFLKKDFENMFNEINLSINKYQNSRFEDELKSVLEDLAKQANSEKEYEVSIKIYEKLIPLLKDDLWRKGYVYLWIGFNYSALLKYKEAIENLKPVIQDYKYPNFVREECRYYSSIYMRRLGYLKEALQQLQYAEKFLKEIGNKSIRQRVLFEIADLLRTTGNVDKAINIYNEMLKNEKDQQVKLKIYNGLGAAYYKSGNFQEAIRHYEKILETADKSNLTSFEAETILWISDIYFTSGEKAIAEKYLNLILNPNVKNLFHENTAKYLLRRITDSEYKNYIESEKHPFTKYKLYYFLARGYQHNGNEKKSKEFFKKVIETNKGQVWPYDLAVLFGKFK